ncbi:MAG TPA: hypothetical protein VJT54_05490 [Verrucomicrobiae bacterium]|nr:hypothetical protein [Verrucomicrobiae bacterium]
MNPTSPPLATCRSARRLWLWGLLATPLLLVLLVGAGVASLFYLGSDARALRNGLMKSSGVEWQQRIALNAGCLTLGAVRAGLSHARLEPGARAALQSIRSAEVGVYQLVSGTPPPDRGSMLTAADTAMTVRGWERVVGVMDGHNLVAVYLPEKNITAHRLKCCVMAFDGKEMVLVSAQGNPEPLLTYAFDQANLHAQARMPSFMVIAR